MTSRAVHAAPLHLSRDPAGSPLVSGPGRGPPTSRFLLALLLAAPGLAVADPPVPAGGGAASLLQVVAWFLGAWLLVSIVSALLLSRWLRARALANERLSLRIRREDWLVASGEAVIEGARPGDEPKDGGPPPHL